MSGVLSALGNLSGTPGYLLIALVVFLEAALFVGLVVPGETALLIGGVLAQQGQLSLPTLLVVGGVAAVVGDSVGYAIGHRFGPALQRSRPGRWIGDERWERAHDFVHRHGVVAVVLGRWVGVLRALVPAVVGMARYRYRRFLAANIAGGVTWSVAIVAIGYAIGGSISGAESLGGRIGLIGLAVVAVIAAGWWIVTRRRREHSDAAS